MNFLSSVTIAAIVAVFLQLCTSAEILDSKADKINELPGQPKVSFQQFSGYITVDEKQERALFYYFVEAETEPASKPVVLWLNGGPGCSSVGLGAFSEHGPFRPSGERNQYSWNREANMLYLETPAGVGFSYSTNASYYTMVDDKMTAEDNLMFLRRWFVKFPEYKGRDFFITGESYAGHYVPQLALLIVQFNKKEKLFNLKGIAQYDGKLDVCVQDEAQNYLNRNDVKEALHARLVGVTSWSPCSEVLHYQMLNLEASTIPTLSSLIRSGIRVMVYSGDQDSVIPFIGSRSLVQGLGNELGLNTTVAYRVWISQKQVGGWTEVYGDILSFATIRGASHTAPFSQPERSLVLFNAFLEGKPLPAAF
ncbi:serine carboxypeptidase-like 45 isoform X2 [Macadamia integrifolia]|uniref:serine carboxypeptidase-like 45 isoform X2 n=1 Tax=Macadamia integrifolia TaxID=60698 RepID=UPI001C4EAAE2|nr:serine carboxypeptidase-like 45 isoform X2 [Macadamia integrifolia]